MFHLKTSSSYICAKSQCLLWSCSTWKHWRPLVLIKPFKWPHAWSCSQTCPHCWWHFNSFLKEKLLLSLCFYKLGKMPITSGPYNKDTSKSNWEKEKNIHVIEQMIWPTSHTKLEVGTIVTLLNSSQSLLYLESYFPFFFFFFFVKW